jgi:hypothetical protein
LCKTVHAKKERKTWIYRDLKEFHQFTEGVTASVRASSARLKRARTQAELRTTHGLRDNTYWNLRGPTATRSSPLTMTETFSDMDFVWKSNSKRNLHQSESDW